MPDPKTWAIVTGEYPPQRGGVADYTRLVARGLAAAGDQVHVWTSPCAEKTPEDPGIRVHRLPDRFGLRGLLRLDTQLRRFLNPDRVLVQYVPHAFGWKAMNLPFAFWLVARRRTPLWVMFHEVAFPWGSQRFVKHNALGAITRIMASLIARAADRIYVSIPAWKQILEPLLPSKPTIHWLPVPSNLPEELDDSAVAETRARVARLDSTIIGCFGMFAAQTAAMLQSLMPPLLRTERRRMGLLVGRGAKGFAAELVRSAPDLRDRLRALDDLPAEQAANHLASCDLLVQPYPDGVSSRRTSLMSGLALGLPIVTTEGRLSEPLWRATGAVALGSPESTAALIRLAESLLANPEQRQQLGARARALYCHSFALEHTIRRLRS